MADTVTWMENVDQPKLDFSALLVWIHHTIYLHLTAKTIDLRTKLLEQQLIVEINF